ncbi:hypothetical protein Afil01_63730 [Actinorhabdospora filicis]|uniref:Zinc finger CGNR domain-containing protein n=1 Tax=Actinorhabdospora filicis TaxID=1785913 RepID=A0A9W6SVL5_9ACTN|nr:CGNR zinc finger domain-containing protein [Actinorhabdospora filicis]GLZ81566.1 hypothetical protein Afil01_63730 [Actinorhabdospora filicis]
MEPSSSAALVLDFANTVDIEDATDAFGTPAGLASWLRERGLPEDAPLADMLVLREGLRARLLIANGGPADEEAIAAAEELLSRAPVTVRLGGEPEPAAPLGASGAVGALAAAWALTVASGDWARLKQCPDHRCGWVFWDATRSRTRRWCTMRVCGNRAKVRAYAARRNEGE